MKETYFCDENETVSSTLIDNKALNINVKEIDSLK